MNKIEFDRLTAAPDSDVLSIADLHDKSPRTLIYGLDDANNAVHVYIDDVKGDIVVLRYGATSHTGSAPHTPILMRSLSRVDDGEVKSNKDFVPAYRCYPEHCDYEFCSLLQKAGLKLPFGRPQFERQRSKAELYAAPVAQGDTQPLANLNAIAARHSSLKRLEQVCTVTLSNLLWEACSVAKVSFVRQPFTKEIHCQNQDVSRVLQAAEALTSELLEQPPLPSGQVADEICQTMFGSYPDIETLQEFGGELHMSMTLSEKPDVTHSEQVVSSLRGRPFVIRIDGAWVHCIYSVFGDVEGFIKKRAIHPGA